MRFSKTNTWIHFFFHHCWTFFFPQKYIGTKKKKRIHIYITHFSINSFFFTVEDNTIIDRISIQTNFERDEEREREKMKSNIENLKKNTWKNWISIESPISKTLYLNGTRKHTHTHAHTLRHMMTFDLFLPKN